MPSVQVIISMTVVETLALVSGLVFFFLLAREFRNRKQLHLLFFSLSALALSFAFGCLFFGKMAWVFGAETWAGWLARSISLALAIHLLFLLAGLGTVGSRWQSVTFGLFGLLTAILVVDFLQLPLPEPSISQLTLFNSGRLPFGLLGLALAYGMMAVVSAWRLMRAKRHGETGGVNRFLAGGAATGLLTVGLASFASSPDKLAIAGLATAFLVVASALIFLGAVGSGSPDRDVAANPINFIRHSLTSEIVFFSTGLFWVGGFLVTSVLLSFFAQLSYDYHLAEVKQAVGSLSATLTHDQTLLLRDTTRTAALPELEGALRQVAAGALPPAVAAQFSFGDRELAVRLVDAEGRVVLSTRWPQEAGRSVETTDAVIGSALRGSPLARLEPGLALTDRWVIRTAAPTLLADGRPGALVIDYGSIIRPDTFGFAIRSPLTFGLVTDAATVASSGETISAAGLESVRQSLVDGAIAVSELSDSIIAAQRIYSSDGRPEGFFYASLATRTLSGDLYRIISLVSVIALLILLAMSLIVVYGSAAIVKPIRVLHDAIRSFEAGGGQRRQIVKNDSPDEIGDLGRAFNRMSVSIAERTESLQMALREQHDLLINTAYEMRTPLNVFRWTVDMMRFGDTGSLNKQQLELVEQLNQTNHRLTALVRNLLDAAEIERGQIQLKREPTRVEDVIDEVAGTFSVRMRERGLSFSWNRPDRAWPKVLADHERLHQIIVNLVSNAYKYTAPGGRIAIRVDEAAETDPQGQAGRYLKIMVEDTGRGIPAADQQRIFTRFFRARNVSADEIEGAGLGLYLVKRLVELHGGTIWFTSTERVGTTFAFTLPIHQPKS